MHCCLAFLEGFSSMITGTIGSLVHHGPDQVVPPQGTVGRPSASCQMSVIGLPLPSGTLIISGSSPKILLAVPGSPENGCSNVVGIPRNKNQRPNEQPKSIPS